MLPVLALIGRPNVGKSTLFNRLTRTRDALVGSMSGLTRDRQYGEGKIGSQAYIVVDTGGIQATWIKNSEQSKSQEFNIDNLVASQSWKAIEEADAILFLVDARAGLTTSDIEIAQLLREHGKKPYLVVNKIDGLNTDEALTEFYTLGFGSPYPITAEHGTGVEELIEKILQDKFETTQINNINSSVESDTSKDLNLTEPGSAELENSQNAKLKDSDRIKVAFIGRPNVGKSTLVNRILGEERVLAVDLPGTTRDSIFIDFERHNKKYTLIDTAGIRRKAKIQESIEQFSVIKALQAIAATDVVVMLIDARENIVDQDLWLLGFAIESGKALVIAVNKWDNLPPEQRTKVNDELERRLNFVDFAKIHFISALHGTGVGNLFTSINHAYESASRKLDTPELTRILQKIVETHQPPLINGRRIKMRYAHAGGRKPPLIIIHGNQLKSVSLDYRRYLERSFRKALNLSGTPIRIEFKTSENPYIKNY